KKASPRPVVAVSERDRHVMVRFEKHGAKIRLPTGVSTESVKNSLNRVLASASSPARFGSCVQHRTTGDLLMSLVQHSAESIGAALPAMERALMEMGISGFSLCQDRKRIKVLVSQLPFAPSGVGATWDPSNWQGDAAW